MCKNGCDMMNKSRSEMLNNMDVKKLLIKLSVPATLGMLVNALYNLMDSLFVSLSEGEIAVGGLAFAFPLQMIVMAIGLMIGIGSASIFSRAFGVNDKEKMYLTVNTALRFDIVLASIVSIVSYIFLADLLKLFGTADGNFQYAYDYLSVIIIGLVPLTLSMVLNNLARAEGRAQLAMIAMALGTGLNIILDPIFIFDWGLGLGIRGAAIATIISQFISFLFIFYKSLDEKSVLRVNVKKLFAFDFRIMIEITAIGFSTFIRNSVGALVAIVIFNVIGYYTVDSEIYVSVYGVVNRVIMFIFMPAFGIVQGLAPIVGFNFGAKNYDRVIDVIKYATKLLLIYFFIGFLFIQVFSPYIFDLFSSNNNAFFIEYGTYVFRTISYGFVLIGFQVIIGSVYQSLGYPIRAAVVSISRQFIFFLPILAFLTQFYQLDGLWYSFFVADIFAGIMGIGMLLHELRNLGKLKPNS